MAKLEENLRLLESTRAATLSMTRGLTQEQIDWREAPDKWSVGEVLDHLVKSGELYRQEIVALVALAKQGRTPFIRKSVREIDFAPAFLPKSLLPVVDIPFTVMTLFVPPAMRDLMIRYSSVLKGQTPEVARPRHGRPAADLAAELESSLEATVRVLRENAGLNFGRMRLQHPLLGINDVPQLLRLTALHERRHQDQIGRLLAAMPKVVMV